MANIAVKPERFPWFDYSRYSFSLAVSTGTSVFLSGHTASEFDPDSRRIVVRGGMTDQVRTAYAKIEAILEGAGMTFQDVVRIVEYVRPEGIERYSEAASVREDVFGNHRPTVDTVPVRALLRPDAFIEIEITAGPVGPETPVDDSGRVARDSNGVVFLPTVQPIDEDGNLVGAGDIEAQTKAIFTRAGKMLAALGLGFEKVVKISDYLTPVGLAARSDTFGVRQRFLGPVPPASTAIGMPRLLHPEALIQCDFTATREKPIAVDPGWSTGDQTISSHAVRAGKMVFLSSQYALDPESGKVVSEGDIVGQAEQIYGRILEIVAAAGGRTENLVKTLEYVTPDALKGYRDVASVRSRLLSEPYPASTGLVCEALPEPGMMMAVDPLAILD